MKTLSPVAIGFTALIAFAAALIILGLLAVRSVLQQFKKSSPSSAGNDVSEEEQLKQTHKLPPSTPDLSGRKDQSEQPTGDFLRHLAHELKRPLASVQQSTHLLLDELQGSLTVEQRRILEIQLRNAKRISNLVDSMIDLFQLESGEANLQFETCDLAVMLRELVSRFEVQCRQRKIDLQVELAPEPLKVECDQDRLVRAIDHVLENALKFSSAGQTIRVIVELAAHLPSGLPSLYSRPVLPISLAGYAVITVTDSGPGIPEAYKQTIFQKYYQIKNSKQTYHEGIGIGLTICRGILEAHHCAVWVEDNPAGGSVFYLLLPLAAGSTMGVRAKPAHR